MQQSVIVESPPTARDARRTRAKLTFLSAAALVLIVLVAGLLTFAPGYTIYNAFATKTLGRALFITFVITVAFIVPVVVPILVALFARYELPPGVDVTKENGATLWQAVSDVCSAAKIAPPNRILLTADLNAFAASVPTKGMLSRHERVVALGYPLLATLSVEQAGAVIAHEMRHLDGEQTKGDTLHHFVTDIMGRCHARGGNALGKILVYPATAYLNLASRIGAHMSRHHEFEADALAAELFGERTAVEALVAITVLGDETMHSAVQSLTEAWQKGEPVPKSILGAVSTVLHTDEMRDRMRKLLDQELGIRTERYSSHPSLSDRAAALGQKISLPAPLHGPNAAQSLLWQDHDALRDQLDAMLAEMLGHSFESRAKAVAEVEEIVGAQLPAVINGTKTREQAEVVSLLMERTLYSEHSRERHLALLERHPGIPSSMCELAAEKLRAKNVQGADEMLSTYEQHPMMSGEARRFLQWAMDMKEWSVEDSWLREWATHPVTVKRWHAAEADYQHLDKINREDGKNPLPHLVPHGLEAWHIDLIIRELCGFLDVTKLWLSRQPPTANRPYPMFHLLVECKYALQEAPTGIGGLCCLPGPVFDIYKHSWDPFIGNLRGLSRAPGALIYQAASKPDEKHNPKAA